MTSSYKVSKEQGNTFVYEPTNSPNIFSTAVETSPKPLMANEKIVKTEKVIEEKVFPNNSSTFKKETTTAVLPNDTTTFASSNTALGSGGINKIPTAPPAPPAPILKAPLVSNLPLNTLLNGKIGHLRKTQTREMSFNELKTKLFPDATKGVNKINKEPLKPTTATNPTGGSAATKPVPKDSALHNLNDKPASLNNNTAASTNNTSNLGSTATRPTATKAEAAHTGEHYTEPHKPSQLKHVKGIIKEKVGHITKNAKMESNGKALEAEFEKEKFDYQAFQHNSGSK